MESETKYLDKTEGCYDAEYAMRQDIHYRDGEILKLEYINAKRSREIEKLNDQISAMVVEDKRSHPISDTELFHYLKGLLVELSSEDGIASINPDGIDVKYIKAASRYCYPVLFDKYALLDQDDSIKDKIKLADDILHKFNLTDTQMYKYEDLIDRGELEIRFFDHRYFVPEKHREPPLGL